MKAADDKFSSFAPRQRGTVALRLVVGLLLTIALAAGAWKSLGSKVVRRATPAKLPLTYQPRRPLDIGGFKAATTFLEPWGGDATLAEISAAWDRVGDRTIEVLDQQLAGRMLSVEEQLPVQFLKAMLYNYEGQPQRAYEVVEHLRALVEADDSAAQEALYSIIFFQGVTALRRGEDENCVLCRGESSCIIPISRTAVHVNPAGSRLAIRHFMEYLKQFPDDLEARWLLNVAHMTLGEHPDQVDPRFLISLDRFAKSEFDIGRFRDIGHLVGVNRLNQGGAGLMEDFDNDGLLDVVAPTWDATCPLALFRNDGRGAFEKTAAAAGLAEQLGGVYAVQTDYNNDGHIDVFIVRGAWLPFPVRPTLLCNNGDGTFTDVTQDAGLLHPVNSITASWADYDNDGCLDLFVCCEKQTSRLYRNLGDGAFAEVAGAAGVHPGERRHCKGQAWIDCDNDRFPDLFLSYLESSQGSQLFHNNRDGTFTDQTSAMNIAGPIMGFSCWAWDYDNDGWLDLFATSYDRTLADVIQGLQGKPHGRHSNRLYRNLQGSGFEDQAQSAGLDMVFATMGSNFGDFDNDGFLDMYLGTGDPDISTLIPNRMFKNVAGRRFAEITGSSGTGHLQKGHSVACGDWDRDGDVDIYIEMGGATNGDKYHNILFQNPGQNNHWLTVKLVGRQTNRPAIGVRIKAVAAGDHPLTVCRHVSSGSSFGASPLQQTMGLAQSDRIAVLEIQWPTSGTTQVFRNIAADQAIEITEFAEDYQRLDWQPIALPQ
jgi:hypothetical protein